MNVMLNPQQTAALALVEQAGHLLDGTAKATAALGANSLAQGCMQALAALRKAHGTYIHETQRAVSIAAPSDVAKLVTP